MTTLDSITLEVDDLDLAQAFYDAAFCLDGQVVQLRQATAPTTGFRGFTLSVMVAQPADANAVIDAALAAGATTLKPATKSLWGYGGVVQAPDGTIWQVATAVKKDSGPATGRIHDIVLLLGVSDMLVTKRFYLDRGLTVAKSFGRKYVEFEMSSSPVKLALYGRRGLAKVAGVHADGTGSHRLAINSGAGAFSDPDGFAWEVSSMPSQPTPTASQTTPRR